MNTSAAPACSSARAIRVAGVGGVAEAPVGLQARGLMPPAHRRVVLEAASGEDHAARGTDLGAPTVTLDDHPGHAPVAHDEFDQRGVAPHRDTGRSHPREQSGGEGASAGDVFASQGEATDSGADGPHRLEHAAGVAGEQVQPAVGATGDGKGERRREVGGPQQRPVGAQSRGVERTRLDRAPGRGPAGQLWAVVGVTRDPLKAQRGATTQQVDGRGPVVEHGAPPCAGGLAGRDMFEVTLDAFGRVARARLGQHAVARHPDAASGERCGASDVLGLLDEQHRQTRVGGSEGGEHARACPDHDTVELRHWHVPHVLLYGRRPPHCRATCGVASGSAWVHTLLSCACRQSAWQQCRITAAVGRTPT